jgi:Domain of unknown function (DUF4304)
MPATMSDSRDRMIAALREMVVPVLRDMGFSGSFPHFRRIRDSQIDLLTFQFNRYGGSFVVEIAFCAPDGFTTHWGKHIPPNEVQARDIHPTQRLRLGSHPPDKADHWFYYEPERARVYTDTAVELLPLLRSEADRFWQTHQPTMQ